MVRKIKYKTNGRLVRIEDKKYDERERESKQSVSSVEGGSSHHSIRETIYYDIEGELKVCNGFEDLNGLETKHFKITASRDSGNGWVDSKEEIPNSYDNYNYLSTHTFYGSCYKDYEALLRRLGFNVRLANWDGE